MNLKNRIEHLNDWASDPSVVPKVINLPLLFNPIAILTAIKQVTAKQQNLELNKLTIITEATKRNYKQIDTPAKEGFNKLFYHKFVTNVHKQKYFLFCNPGLYISGLYLDGARWDVTAGYLEESRPKEIYFMMPVMLCKVRLSY